MSTELTVGEVLNLAADYIEQHGWCRRRNETDDGRVCAMGAVGKVCDVQARRGLDLFDAARERLLRQIGCVGLVSLWNDEQVSAEPVIAALRAAAVGSQVLGADPLPS